MFRPRIIPVLLLKDQGLVKSKQFKDYTYIGDPINAVRIYNDLKADELVFLDIEATKENRLISSEFIKNVGEEANMPFAAGGGIKTIADIRTILSAGAEKVIICSHAAENPDFILEASETFGSSTIVVCIDVKKAFLKGKKVWTKGGSKNIGADPVEYAKKMAEKGAGEIIVQSIDNDGMMAGYDIELIKTISENVSIPVVALGGAGNLEHLKQVYKEAHATGLAAASIFVYQGKMNGVLINYPDRKEVEELFGNI
ncbi:MAG: AglZ/HisF2 family acetamidino modification protein [Desulfobulbaceae bacterium]|nr:AglZ/HisF2 family acetamidino modification protein [Desulfobulbaceae bacterium]